MGHQEPGEVVVEPDETGDDHTLGPLRGFAHQEHDDQHDHQDDDDQPEQAHQRITITRSQLMNRSLRSPMHTSRPGAAAQGVGAEPGAEPVVAASAEQDVVAGAAVDPVVAAEPEDRVGTEGAEQDVGVASADDQVEPGRHGDRGRDGAFVVVPCLPGRCRSRVVAVRGGRDRHQGCGAAAMRWWRCRVLIMWLLLRLTCPCRRRGSGCGFLGGGFLAVRLLRRTPS